MTMSNTTASVPRGDLDLGLAYLEAPLMIDVNGHPTRVAALLDGVERRTAGQVQYDQWKPVDRGPGPAEGEPVFGVLADGRVGLFALQVVDPLDGGPDVTVWAPCYGTPSYYSGGWHVGEVEWDDDYDVRLWCRLPTPPALPAEGGEV